jgi:predicted ATPase
MIKSIALTNFLSYGGSKTSLDLKSLNVLIGPNGSGKSNLIEALELLRATPKDLLAPIRDGGGVLDWLWKSPAKTESASIEIVAEILNSRPVRYVLSFTEVAQRFEIVDERIENEIPDEGHSKPYLYYAYSNGRGVLNVKGGERRLERQDIDPVASILAQRKDPDQYPELTQVGRLFEQIRIYREWSFGRYSTPRLPQKADMPNESLSADASNLGLVLNRLRREPVVKRKLLDALGALYEGIDDFDVQIEGGTVQVFLQEGTRVIPATRLSDGTLRYLCLLAILCQPNPGQLICIEEPELGLHPDILPTIAKLLKEASERTQLIVTTHSDVLVDCLSDMPESVVVAERGDGGSSLERLDAERLKPWLEKYRLGQLWTSGEIGGTRW